MRIARTQPVELLLRAGHGDDREPATDEEDRRAISQDPVLRQSSDGDRVWPREGEEINRKRVKRLMGLMGLEAIHPGPERRCGTRITRSIPIC